MIAENTDGFADRVADLEAVEVAVEGLSNHDCVYLIATVRELES